MSHRLARGSLLVMTISTALSATMVGFGSVASAQELENDVVAAQVGGELGDVRDELIESLITRIETLERTVEELQSQLAVDGAEAPSVGREALAGLETSAQDTPADTATPGADALAVAPIDAQALEIERREQEQLIRSAFQRALVERGNLLMPPRTVDFAPSMSYLHSSTENIVIDGFTVFPVLVVGDIVSERVRRDLVLADATLRFGLPWRSQLDVRIPYSYQKQDTFTADNQETELSSSGLGDLELALSRELFRSGGDWPDLVGSLRWRSRSGTSPFEVGDEELALGGGFNSVSLSLTGTKVVDPLVYFGSVNYSYNDAHQELVGLYDPGDGLGFSIGMAIALNLNSTLAFSYDHQLIRKSKIDGMRIPGSDLSIGIFSVGGSYALSDDLLVDLSLGIGITSDSPDLRLSASFPFRFRY